MDVSRVEHAQLRPGTCLCGNHAGPFIDTRMERPVIGRVYLCFRCVFQFARKAGCLDPKQREELEVALMEAAETITGLRALLEDAERSRVVSLADVRDLVRAETARPASRTPARSSTTGGGDAA